MFNTMSMISDDRIPLLSFESDEEETRKKQIFEHVEPNVVLVPTGETEYLDIHKENSDDVSISVNQGLLLSTDTNEGSETNLKHAIIDIAEPNSPQSMPRKLPDGKKYHLFVSFCSDDEDLVKPIVTKLEEEGLRCMLDGRDFIGGKGIIENIIDALKESQKILLMMTPNFVKSGPCMFEQQQAVHIFNWMEKRSNCWIPVLLRPCEIPAHLKNLTYIDADKAGKDSSLITKIIESYDLNDTAEYYMPDSKLQELRLLLRQLSIKVSKYINGTVVTDVKASKTLSGVRGSGWQFNELTDSQRQELGKAKLQEAESVYEEIRKKLNSCLFMRLYGIFAPGKRCCASCVWINIFFLAWFFFLIVTIGTFLKESNSKVVNVVMIVFPILGWCIYPCITCYVMAKTRKFILSTTYDYGKRTCLNGNFLILKGDQSAFNLVFIWYDANPCLEYIERKLKTLNPMDSQSEISDRAKIVLEQCLSVHLYNGSITWKQLPETDERRHDVPVSLNRRCLCQLAGVEIEDNSVMPEGQNDGTVIV